MSTVAAQTKPVVVTEEIGGQERLDVKHHKHERIIRAAVDAVYSDYCSNSVAELNDAVVDLIGVPLDQDND